MAGAQASQANCGHCGAPLPLSHGPIVVCQYCRREQRVGSAHPVLPAMPMPAATRRNASVAWAIVGALLIAGVAAGFSLVRLLLATPSGALSPRLGAVPGAALTPGSAGGPMFWLDYPPFVVLGTNTTTPLVVGMAYWQNDSQVTALDGASGKVLWHVPSPSARLYSDGDALLAFDDGKKLGRYEPKTGVKRWNMTFAEPVYDITFGPNCASLMYPGGKTLGLDLQLGQQANCTPRVANRAPVERDKLVDVQGALGDLTLIGSVQLDDKPINPEPARLAAQISRAGRVLWKVAPAGVEPVWTSDGFGRSLVLTPAGVFVFGRSSSDHGARWLLLDSASGRELYRQSSAFKVETPVQLTSSGTLVFAEHDQRVEAYRIATGELAWSVGLRK